MSALVLTGLALVVAGLCGLGLVGLVRQVGPVGRIAGLGTLTLSLLGASLALVALLAGAVPASLDLPLGPPWGAMALALDGLSALFLLLLFAAAAACAGTGLDAAVPWTPVLVGTAAATLLAADGFAVVFWFAATAAAAAALVLVGQGPARPARALLGGGAFAALCLTAAMVCLDPTDARSLVARYADIRLLPPQGAGATAVLGLTLLALAGAIGLAPLHRWLPRTLAAAAGPAGGLIGAAVPLVGLYLLVRLLLDLAGPAQPGWWGTALLALGAAGAVVGAARALCADDLRQIAGAAAIMRGGLAVAGIGVALAARALDLAPLAAFALAATLLLAAAHAFGGMLLTLALGAAEAGGGSRRLDRLGGLLRGMPLTTGCALLAAASLAALPPTAGFAALWTLIEALIAVARPAGVGRQAVATLALLAIAGAATLAAVAAVRLIGIAFLGRPRTPRAAAAQDPARPARVAMVALAGLAMAIGIFPGVLLLLAAPALRQILGADLADRAGWFAIAAAPEGAALTAVSLAGLLALFALGALRLSKWRAIVGEHAETVWEGGAAPPPPWLPFGDPATQIGPAEFGLHLRPIGGRLSRRVRLHLLRTGLHLWRRLAERADRLWRPEAGGALATLLATAVLLLACLLAAAA